MSYNISDVILSDDTPPSLPALHSGASTSFTVPPRYDFLVYILNTSDVLFSEATPSPSQPVLPSYTLSQYASPAPPETSQTVSSDVSDLSNSTNDSGDATRRSSRGKGKGK